MLTTKQSFEFYFDGEAATTPALVAAFSFTLKLPHTITTHQAPAEAAPLPPPPSVPRLPPPDVRRAAVAAAFDA